jgi:hypothetical protein
MDNNNYHIKWLIISKTIVYIVTILIIIAVFVTARYGYINDFPKCRHRNNIRQQMISNSTKEYIKDNHHPILYDDKNNKDIKLISESSKLLQPVYGCGGHHPDPIDIGSLKNGDIIILSYSGVRSWFSAATYGSVWTHPGLVYIDPNTKEPYILEAAAYRPPYVGQIVRVPLLKWMSINRNARGVALIKLNKDVPSDLIDKGFSKFENEDIGVEGLRLSWFRFVQKKTPKTVHPESFFASEDRKRKPAKKTKAGKRKYWPLPFGENNSSEFDYLLTCHEVVISTLQDSGVLDKTYTPCSYLPNAIFNRDIPTLNGYEYLEPEEICFDQHVSGSLISVERDCN